MTLTQFSQLAQAVGSLSVVASLVFVGIQLRQSTKATRAASHHAITEALNRVNLAWARDAELTRVFLAGCNDRQALTPDDRWRFDSVLRAYLHVCETMYTQAALGAGDSDLVDAEQAGIRSVFRSAGVKAWWAENPFGFSQEFRRHIDRLVGDDTAGHAAFAGRDPIRTGPPPSATGGTSVSPTGGVRPMVGPSAGPGPDRL